MIFTNNKDIHNKLISIRAHGKGTDKYDNVRVGNNGRLDTLLAAILLIKFYVFDQELTLSQKVATKYNASLKCVLQIPFI